jgi:hypothetical protein
MTLEFAISTVGSLPTPAVQPRLLGREPHTRASQGGRLISMVARSWGHGEFRFGCGVAAV